MMVSIIYPVVAFHFRTFWVYCQVLHLLAQHSILRMLLKITFWFCLAATLNCLSHVLTVCVI